MNITYVSKTVAAINGEPNTECLICLKPFKEAPKEPVVKTNCEKGHLYDFKCIREWFEKVTIQDRKCLICNVYAFPMKYIGRSLTSHPLQSLHMACLSNNAEEVRRVLSNNPSIDFETIYDLKNGEEKSLLLIALQSGSQEVARMLIIHGVNANKPLENGQFPLHAVVTYGCTKLVGLLIHNGAEVDSLPAYSKYYSEWRVNEKNTGIHIRGTPVGYAVRAGHLQMVQRLINAGSKAKLIHDKAFDESLLSLAISNERTNIVEYLLSDDLSTRRAREISQYDYEIFCFIKLSIITYYHVNLPMMKLLLRVCNTERIRSNRFLIPLWLAAKYGQLEVFETMLKAGFKNHISYYGTTLREYAQKCNQKEIIKLIDKYGVNDSPSSWLHRLYLRARYYLDDSQSPFFRINFQQSDIATSLVTSIW